MLLGSEARIRHIPGSTLYETPPPNLTFPQAPRLLRVRVAGRTLAPTPRHARVARPFLGRSRSLHYVVVSFDETWPSTSAGRCMANEALFPLGCSFPPGAGTARAGQTISEFRRRSRLARLRVSRAVQGTGAMPPSESWGSGGTRLTLSTASLISTTACPSRASATAHAATGRRRDDVESGARHGERLRADPGRGLPRPRPSDALSPAHAGADRVPGGDRHPAHVRARGRRVRARPARDPALRGPERSHRRHRPRAGGRSVLHPVQAGNVRRRHLDVHRRADPCRRVRGRANVARGAPAGGCAPGRRDHGRARATCSCGRWSPAESGFRAAVWVSSG